jgi:hypothetical protein
MRNNTWNRMFGWTLMALLLIGGAALAQDLTADDILDRMETEGDVLAEGSMIVQMRFDNVYSDGTTASNTFAGLSKPGKSLMLFLEPEDVQGTIFLTLDPEAEDADTRLWLYLPLLGIPKELVSEEDRGGSFADSSISYEDIGGDGQREDYDAVLIGEEVVTVGNEDRTAYVLESTAKPDADEDIVRTVLWVDKESFVMLRMEAYNDLGNLEQTLDVIELGEFEGHLVVDGMLARDVLEESETTIVFLERRRPADEIPDEVFDPETLASFDPAAWGL